MLILFVLLLIVNSYDPYTCLGSTSSTCSRKEKTLISVELTSGGVSQFFPFIVDFGSFTRLRVIGAHEFMERGPSTLTIHYGGGQSFPRYYWNQNAIAEAGIAEYEIFVTYFSVELYVTLGRIDTEDSDYLSQNMSNIFRFTKNCNSRNTYDDGKSDECIWLNSDDSRYHYCVGIGSQRDCGLKFDSVNRTKKYETVTTCEKRPDYCVEYASPCTEDVECIEQLRGDKCIEGLCCNSSTYTNETCETCFENMNCSSDTCYSPYHPDVEDAEQCDPGTECVMDLCCNISSECFDCWNTSDICETCISNQCEDTVYEEDIGYNYTMCVNRTQCCNYTEDLNCRSEPKDVGWDYHHEIQIFLYWVGTDNILNQLTSSDRGMEKFQYYVNDFSGLYNDIIDNNFGTP